MYGTIAKDINNNVRNTITITEKGSTSRERTEIGSSYTMEPRRSNEKCSIDIDTIATGSIARAADAFSFDRASLIDR